MLEGGRRKADKSGRITCICLSGDIFNSRLLRHTGGNKVIRRRKWEKTSSWQNENDLRKRASAFSTNTVNTESGDYLGDFGRYSSELLQSPPPSFFPLPSVLDREGVKERFYTRTESRRRRPRRLVRRFCWTNGILLLARLLSPSDTCYERKHSSRRLHLCTREFFLNVWKRATVKEKERARKRERGRREKTKGEGII